MVHKQSVDKPIQLVIDSLFLAQDLTIRFRNNSSSKELADLAGKAWKRHWRRVQKAIDAGYKELTIPTEAK